MSPRRNGANDEEPLLDATNIAPTMEGGSNVSTVAPEAVNSTTRGREALKRLVPDDVPFTEVLKDAARLLPHQAVLENFVHHNPWEVLQDMDFFEAQAHVRQVLSSRSPGARLTSLVHSDPRKRANAALSELCQVFLDRGAAKWAAPYREKGFLYFFAELEGAVVVPSMWRRPARDSARLVLQKLSDDSSNMSARCDSLAEELILENLESLGTPQAEMQGTLTAMLWDMQGYASMFNRMETHPLEAPADPLSPTGRIRVRLIDFVAVLCILQRASVEALAMEAGCPRADELKNFLDAAPRRDGESAEDHEDLQNPSGLAFADQNMTRRHALEQEYERVTLSAVARNTLVLKEEGEESARPLLQVYTCIDERECSFRRHLEEAGTSGGSNCKTGVETFGVAGFFDFPIRFRGANSCGEETLAPEFSLTAATPNWEGTILKEEPHPDDLALFASSSRRMSLLARLELALERSSFASFDAESLLAVALHSPVIFMQLVFTCFFPTAKRQMVTGVSSMLGNARTVITSPYSTSEAAAKLARTFHNIGCTTRDDFARIVMVTGHGSRTVNNPFDAAHNCGACGGREGGANARLMTHHANETAVRQALRETHGVLIPDDTWFVGGFHDTSSELVELFDTDTCPSSHLDDFKAAEAILLKARENNALERCSKFLLSGVSTPEAALAHVHTRSTDLGEARPELGHATNAAVILGRRELTQGLFLARRAFCPSYDPFKDDDVGTALERVIAPALVVCSGISLEYLFSTVEGGAGTKVAMNLVGNFGVQQGTSGDLLIGLPTQMTEMHSPTRILYLIDAPVARVKAVLARRPELRAIVENEWVRFFVRDPYDPSGAIYKQTLGEYHRVHVDTLSDSMHPLMADTSNLGSKKMSMPTSTSGIARNVQLYGTAAEAGAVVQAGGTRVTDGRTDVTSAVSPDCPSFKRHLEFLRSTVLIEGLVAGFVAIGIIASAALAIYSIRKTEEKRASGAAMELRATGIVVGGSVLSLLILGFSRRYLHGEDMFVRLQLLALALTCGFNLVASSDMYESHGEGTAEKGTALPHFAQMAVVGWSLIGFSSALLIGAYNSRPTAQTNATFVFAVYQLSDSLMIAAAALCGSVDATRAEVGALCLVAGALVKTSQLPFPNLFARAMEGASPSSALGYGALCAHAGIVILSLTEPLWVPFKSARIYLGVVGGLTAVVSGLVANVRADRKGAIASATSGTVGLLYVILALGFADVALAFAFGHAVLRTEQILRAHNGILENHTRHNALGPDHQHAIKARSVPPFLWKFAWRFNRFGADMRLPTLGAGYLHRIRQCFCPLALGACDAQRGNGVVSSTVGWGCGMQWVVAAVLMILAGVPGSPLTEWRDDMLISALRSDDMRQPIFAGVVLLGLMAWGTWLMWVLLAHIVNTEICRRHRIATFAPGKCL